MSNIENRSTNEVTAVMLNEFNDKKESASNELKSGKKEFPLPCSFWDMAEEYFPAYYISDEVNRNDILSKYFDDELSEEDETDLLNDTAGKGRNGLLHEFAESSEHIFKTSLLCFAEAYHKWKKENEQQ